MLMAECCLLDFKDRFRSPWGVEILGSNQLSSGSFAQKLFTLACSPQRINYEESQGARTRVKCLEGHGLGFSVAEC